MEGSRVWGDRRRWAQAPDICELPGRGKTRAGAHLHSFWSPHAACVLPLAPPLRSQSWKQIMTSGSRVTICKTSLMPRFANWKPRHMQKNSESHWPAFHALHYHPCRCWPAPCSCLRTPSSQHPPDSQPQSTWRLPEDPNSRACRCAVAASPIDPDALGGAAPPSTGPAQQTAAATAATACHTAGAAPRKSTLLPLASHFLPCSARCSACTEPSCGCRGPKSSRAASP